MLTFVGLGLYDERSITIAGQEAIAAADRVFMERYTSELIGTAPHVIADFHGVEIEELDREAIERSPDILLAAAEVAPVVLLVGGDPLVATTHVDLRLRAAARDIETHVVHGVSIASAACSISGLQNYRFGKATTLPFPGTFGNAPVPTSVYETIVDNRERGLHSMVFLDIDRQQGLLRADVAAGALASLLDEQLGVVLARVGSEEPLVVADRLDRLADQDFGEPLHLLVLPGPLHDIEAEALRIFAGAPDDVLITT